MIGQLTTVLSGAIVALSFVIALFFLRFWVRTRDPFHVLFALAFAIDGVSRLALGVINPSGESDPYGYLPRLLMFVLIVLAVVQKNRGK